MPTKATETIGSPPRRQANTASQVIATPWSTAPPTRVAHAGCPNTPDGIASSQKSSGPGWLQP